MCRLIVTRKQSTLRFYFWVPCRKSVCNFHKCLTLNGTQTHRAVEPGHPLADDDVFLKCCWCWPRSGRLVVARGFRRSARFTSASSARCALNTRTRLQTHARQGDRPTDGSGPRFRRDEFHAVAKSASSNRLCEGAVECAIAR